jgi:hypothetical protein
MPTARQTNSTFASGEFDPLLSDREDVAFFYSSAKRIENGIVLPQGGIKRREGMRRAGKQRGPITAVDISGYTFGAPNGGTAANLDSETASDNVTTTGEINTATEYVVATIDAGSAQRVSMADITPRLIGGTIATGTLALQSSDDDVTYTTRASILIGTSSFTRRFATAPDTDLGTHRYWRLAFLNPDGDDYGTDEVEVYGFKMWTEAGKSQSGAVPGAVRKERITATPTSEFWCVMTAGNADIWSADGVWKAAVPIPHAEADVPWIRTSQNRDSLLLYQIENPVHQIQRLENDDSQWRADPFVFSTVSQFPFPDATTGGQNEQQELNFQSMTAGNRFVFELNGDISDEVAWSATAATNITNITAALEGMEDITSVTVTNPTGTSYLIEFDGDDANTFFPILIVDILDGSGIVTNSRKQYGRPNQEDLWSPTRGYPACGTFYQGGHWMGGFKAVPDVVARSRAGDFTDFKGDQDPVATSPLVLQPDIDDLVEIRAIYPGRSLQIFTSSVELYAPDEPITPDNAALKVTSRRGHQSRTQPVDVQGGTFFVDRNGTALREYLFSESEQSYTAEPISTLGGHLVAQPVDMALRRSVDTDEPTIVYLVNQGRDRNFEKVPGAALTVDRAQQISAMARITTRLGDLEAVSASQGGDVAFMVNRRLAGNAWNYLEVLDENHMGDHSVEVANPDLETFTATAAQTVFTYTFTNPTDEIDIGVFTREGPLDLWRRVEPDLYTLDTGAKTITFDTGLDAGKVVAIAPRQTSFTVGHADLDGIECYLHVDGRATGAHTPASGSVTILGDEGFWFQARLGLRMVPRIVLQAFKGQGGQSPTMQKQRIFRALINLERTSNLAIGLEGEDAKAVSLASLDSGRYDADLEETLYSGQVRISGFKGWKIEPRIVITQSEPGPFSMVASRYDIRF